VNFLQSKGVKGVIEVLAKANRLMTHPIKVSDKPFLVPREGNKGDNIEYPIPLNIFIKKRICDIFILINFIFFLIYFVLYTFKIF